MAISTQLWGTTVIGTGGITSLASSATWVAGYSWFAVDCTSFDCLDVQISGKIRVGTTPTVNTLIRMFLVASHDGTNWPTAFSATPGAVTVASQGVRKGFMKSVCDLFVDATTSDRDYDFDFTALQGFGPVLPRKFVCWVSHNCVAALNGTGGNHTYRYTPIYGNSA
jgi:hypothetical protein